MGKGETGWIWLSLNPGPPPSLPAPGVSSKDGQHENAEWKMGGVCSQPKREEPKKKKENCLGRYSEKGRHRPTLVPSLCDLFNYVSVRYTNRRATMKEVWPSGLGPILSISALFTTNIFASLYRRLLQTVHIILWQFPFKTITKKKKERYIYIMVSHQIQEQIWAGPDTY